MAIDFLNAVWRRLFRNGAAVILSLDLAVGAWAAGDDSSAPGRNPKAAEGDYNPTNSLGSWIWAAETFDRQNCQLWRAFEIPAGNPVTHARLVMTVDNEFMLYLDGRGLGRGAEWRELFDYDVSHLLSPGTHVLAVKAYNASSFAGMIFGMRVDFADGKVLEIKSDGNWKIVPEGAKNWATRTTAARTWTAATVIAPFGSQPWWTVPQNINPMPTLQPIMVYFWQTGWFQISLLCLSGVVVLNSLRLVAQLALHRKEQWLLQKERARITRDIHDDLGARMTQLVLHGEVAQSELPAESETRLQIDRICEEARGILSTMDEVLWAVNPKRDSFRDFSSYICGYAQEFFKSTRIQCWFDLDPEASSVALSLPLKRGLLMAIKEGLNNVVKHSGATEVVLQIKWHTQTLVVAISDNGKGFDQASLRPGRNGLTSMSERMSELGGACRITSELGKGCRTEFSIPLKNARRRFWALGGRMGAVFANGRNGNGNNGTPHSSKA
ncbi:Integral membrane sensor signal transduction histidine kinase (fragment) [Verrucomicrobia bacterium]